MFSPISKAHCCCKTHLFTDCRAPTSFQGMKINLVASNKLIEAWMFPCLESGSGILHKQHISSCAKAHNILNQQGTNPVQKMMDVSSVMLQGVAILCALNAGHDVPVSV